MAKQVRMIAPFEALRGNVSGKQVLKYPTRNNKAWDAPVGKRSYANNYAPRYIVSQSAKTGKVYFGLKRKSAVFNSAKSRAAMAAFGAASELFRAAKLNLTTLSLLQLCYSKSPEYASGISFESWFAKTANGAMRAWNSPIVYVESKDGETTTVSIKNPYIDDSAEVLTDGFNKDILVKFWEQLNDEAISFSVDGRKGIAQTGISYSELIETYTGWNVLGLVKKTFNEADYVGLDGEFVVDEEGNYIGYQDEVVNGSVLRTTDENPA